VRFWLSHPHRSMLTVHSRALRDMGFSKQALYCYSKAYSLDPTNVNMLWDRAILAKEIGQINTVRAVLSAVLGLARRSRD
jgi:hypothetical protein